ncbi:glucuronyl esterase domain-containing protein [Maribellus mangrovi]|uniref:glucuronyl esterase domain-containing protein n=1 Tax=Maribellus mangrovi TaxID=3133146 RepID=UPI0030ED8DC1
MIRTVILLLFSVIITTASAQWEPNYDEAKVPQFKLPNPLKTFSGKKIRNVKNWEKKRRPELLDYFAENIYGKIPDKLKISGYDILEESENALGGKAIRKQVELTFEKNSRTLHFTILIYLPKSNEKVPVFLGYNFLGNHTVCEDANILISTAWVANNPSLGIVNHQLTEQSRGVRTDRWAIREMLAAGFGFATIYYGEIDPDKNDMTDGVQSLFYIDDQLQPADDEWGSIAAWAWGLSRALDYFEGDDDVDESKVVVFGHSRLGKTALWAGASDQRFAGVISNDSGCGGAALFKREFGETIWRINRSFPYWFCDNFKNFNHDEKKLIVDQHELIALIAPRPVYVASAEEDQWADPKGEFLAAYYAGPVYKLYGIEGIPEDVQPPVNKPILNTVAYHIRSGGHDVTAFDWKQYINWAQIYIQ